MRALPTSEPQIDIGDPARMWRVWHAGDYYGDTRPMGRVTIQDATVLHSSTHKGRWANFNFSSATVGQATPKELPNVKSIQIQRSIGQDSASCTIVLYNTTPLPIGDTPNSKTGDLDLPGYYTWNRGLTKIGRGRWQYPANEWKNLIVPGRVVRTYQGYGFDADVCPDVDPNLACTGTWLIDDVELDTKYITLTCRDFAALLLDSIVFPPVIPLSKYPISFEAVHTVPGLPTSKWVEVPIRWDDDSGTPWYGRGSAIHGHKGAHAFDNNAGSYWLSVGNANPTGDYAFEWVQGKLPNVEVDAVRFKPWAGNYIVYVSVFRNGQWQGGNIVPYNRNSPPAAPNGSDIPYVKKTTCGWEREQTINLPHKYTEVTKLRLTFHRLANSHLFPYAYRAGVRSFEALKLAKTKGKSRKEGNYSDYTDIVKYFCAVGGFYWPVGANRRSCDGTHVLFSFTKHDPVVGAGRVWGDFERTGTSGPAPIPASQFDKQPLMDAINYIRDIVGYIFFVEETGAVVFRSPNIWKVGNYLRPDGHTPAYVKNVPVIDERIVLRDIKVRLSRREFRRRTFVANVAGNNAATAAPVQSELGQLLDINLDQIDIWTDQHFASKKECQVMADLIQVRRLFTYRTDTLTIAANPYLQPDDQVRVVERVTGETFIHYLRGVNSSWDNDQGEYTMELETHWLGEQPFAKWAFQPNRLSKDTRLFLQAMGRLPK